MGIPDVTNTCVTWVSHTLCACEEVLESSDGNRYSRQGWSPVPTSIGYWDCGQSPAPSGGSGRSRFDGAQRGALSLWGKEARRKEVRRTTYGWTGSGKRPQHPHPNPGPGPSGWRRGWSRPSLPSLRLFGTPAAPDLRPPEGWSEEGPGREGVLRGGSLIGGCGVATGPSIKTLDIPNTGPKRALVHPLNRPALCTKP